MSGERMLVCGGTAARRQASWGLAAAIALCWSVAAPGALEAKQAASKDAAVKRPAAQAKERAGRTGKPGKTSRSQPARPDASTAGAAEAPVADDPVVPPAGEAGGELGQPPSTPVSAPPAETPAIPEDRFPLWALTAVSALGGAFLGVGAGLALGSLFLRRRASAPSADKLSSGAGKPKDLNAAWAELEWLEGAVRSLEAGQRALEPAVERLLERFLNQVESLLREKWREDESAAAAEANRIRVELDELTGRIRQLELTLDQLRETASSRLARDMALLARQGFARAASSSAAQETALVVQSERALAEFLSQAMPTEAEIQERMSEVTRLRDAIEDFHRLAERMGISADGFLRSLLEDCGSLLQELESLGQSAVRGTLPVRFALDVPLRGDPWKEVAEVAASGLLREIQRVSDVGRYYDLRWKRLSARAAVECADFADSRLDPQRRVSEVQQALQRIFAAAGVAEIAPQRNDTFHAVEHAVVRVTRKSHPDDQSQAVADLLTRGFRQGTAIVRKAGVILFE